MRLTLNRKMFPLNRIKAGVILKMETNANLFAENCILI